MIWSSQQLIDLILLHHSIFIWSLPTEILSGLHNYLFSQRHKLNALDHGLRPKSYCTRRLFDHKRIPYLILLYRHHIVCVTIYLVNNVLLRDLIPEGINLLLDLFGLIVLVAVHVRPLARDHFVEPRADPLQAPDRVPNLDRALVLAPRHRLPLRLLQLPQPLHRRVVKVQVVLKASR